MAARVHTLEPADGLLQFGLAPRPVQLLSGLRVAEADLEAVYA